MRLFRIVIADDEDVGIIRKLREACPSAEIWHITHLGHGHKANARLIGPEGVDQKWSDDRLLSADVLILDMGMTCFDEDWGGISKVVSEVHPEYGGARFLLGTYAHQDVTHHQRHRNALTFCLRAQPFPEPHVDNCADSRVLCRHAVLPPKCSTSAAPHPVVS